MKYSIQILLPVFIILLTATFSIASIVDESFKPFVTKTDSTYVYAIAVQPDGKYLVGGDFTTVNGSEHNNLVRFNLDGTVDNSFQISFGSPVSSLVVQEDGKILVGGTSLEILVNNVSRRGIIRLNYDGSIDSNFLNGRGTSGVKSISRQPDGKVIIGGAFISIDGQSRQGLARLNADGSLDTAFNPTPAGGWTAAVAVLPDGDIMVGGEFSTMNGQLRRRIARINSDGTLDSSLTLNFDGNPYVIKLQADGKILIGGRIEAINGMIRKDLVRLNADGTLDQTFIFDSGNYAGYTYSIDQQPDGKILVGGSYSEFGTQAHRSLFRLNENGSFDDTFSIFTLYGSVIAAAFHPTGEILIGGARFDGENNNSCNLFHRLNSTGTVDPNFPASIGENAYVGAIGTLPNGKIYIGGNFVEVNGKERKRIARLNANGTLDTTFNPIGASGEVVDLAVQPDGKVIIGGSFGLVNRIARQNIARLNTDGSLDTSFEVGEGADGTINKVAIQPDGKILIGGIFYNYNNIARNNIARINSDGSLDTAFNSGSPGLSNSVTEIVPLPDGKVLISGWFYFLNSVYVGNIARLNSDGTRDTSFNAGGSGTTGGTGLTTIDGIAVQPDGKLIISGSFFGYNNVARNSLARLNSDGTLDPGFAPRTQNVFALLLQPDGKILVGGNISSISGIPQNKLTCASLQT